MITLEVHNQLITWPDDFAIVMMRYYKKHDVPFMLRWRRSAGMLEDSELSCVSEEILAMAKEDKGLSTSC